MSLAELVENIGFVSVLNIGDLELIVQVGRALLKSNIGLIEISAKKVNPDSTRELSAALDSMVIGVGDVENIDQAVLYSKSGAQYIAIEQPDEAFLNECKSRDIFVIPVCRTADKVSEYFNRNMKLICLMFQNGVNLDEIDDLGHRFSGIKLIVKTDYIPPDTIKDYSDKPQVAALAGKWISPSDMINEGMFEKISTNAAEFVHHLLNFKIAHVGINAEDEVMARQISDSFSDIFGISSTEEITSFFVSTLVEVNKAPGRGTHGHMGIAVNNMNRAVYHVEKRGYKIDVAPLAEGRRGPLYLYTEVGGFALHLI